MSRQFVMCNVYVFLFSQSSLKLSDFWLFWLLSDKCAPAYDVMLVILVAYWRFKSDTLAPCANVWNIWKIFADRINCELRVSNYELRVELLNFELRVTS